MLMSNQLIAIKINNTNFQFYQHLGYDIKKGDVIYVPPSQLKDGSHAHVSVMCDECKDVFEREYRQYRKRCHNNKDYCSKCSAIIRKQTMIEKYGVEYPLQNEDIKNKTKQTNMQKYGVEYVLQAPSVIEKRKNTCIEKYGYENPGMSPEIQKKNKQYFMETYGCENPFMLDEVKEKIKQTCIEKYGVEYYSQNDDCKNKTIATNMEKYGVPHSMQCQEVKQKAIETNLRKYGFANPIQHPDVQQKVRMSLMENGTGKASAQQIQLHEIIKKKYPEALLNYPFSTCSLDVFIEIDGVKIDCEYDCWYWHQDQQRDIKRDKFLQSKGFKTLRIKSGRLLPTEQELFSAIDYLVNTEHHLKEIVLSDWKEKEAEECQKQLLVAL
jgi:hypothetical protein